MTSFSSLTLDKIGLWCGMVLAGGALVIGGSKALEHASFLPADAQVTSTEIRCEMNSSGDRQRVMQLVMCGDVANVKAQNPGTEWRVTAQPFVTLAFTTAAGGQVSTQVALSTLNRATTAIGDRIAILYRADRPARVTVQATTTFFALNGSALAGGLLLCAMAFGLRRRSDEAEYGESAVAAQGATEPSLPHVSSPAMWSEPSKNVLTPHAL
jgi:hypothetical protein